MDKTREESIGQFNHQSVIPNVYNCRRKNLWLTTRDLLLKEFEFFHLRCVDLSIGRISLGCRNVFGQGRDFGHVRMVGRARRDIRTPKRAIPTQRAMRAYSDPNVSMIVGPGGGARGSTPPQVRAVSSGTTSASAAYVSCQMARIRPPDKGPRVSAHISSK